MIFCIVFSCLEVEVQPLDCGRNMVFLAGIKELRWYYNRFSPPESLRHQGTKLAHELEEGCGYYPCPICWDATSVSALFLELDRGRRQPNESAIAGRNAKSSLDEKERNGSYALSPICYRFPTAFPAGASIQNSSVFPQPERIPDPNIPYAPSQSALPETIRTTARLL